MTVTLESHRIQGLGLGAVHRVEVQWDKHEGYRIYSIDAQGVERIPLLSRSGFGARSRRRP